MNVVMTGTGKCVEVQATAEGRPYSTHELQQMLELAAVGARVMHPRAVEIGERVG